MARPASDTVAVMGSWHLLGAVLIVVALGALGCGEDEKEGQASGDVVTGDVLESCLTEEGLDVEQREPGPIGFKSETFTPEANLVESPDDPVPIEILVLEPEDAAFYDQSLPAGVDDPTRFGTNVLVFPVSVGLALDPVVQPDLKRALNACVG
jgi:hypothetical protein